MTTRHDRRGSLRDYLAKSPRELDEALLANQREQQRLQEEEQVLRFARNIDAVDRLSDLDLLVRVNAIVEEKATAGDTPSNGSSTDMWRDREDESSSERLHDLPSADTQDEQQRVPQGAPMGSPTRVLVRAILADDPERIWEPREMHEELRRRGYDSKVKSTRVMLQRLHASGHAARPDHGRYKASESIAGVSRRSAVDAGKT